MSNIIKILFWSKYAKPNQMLKISFPVPVWIFTITKFGYSFLNLGIKLKILAYFSLSFYFQKHTENKGILINFFFKIYHLRRSFQWQCSESQNCCRSVFLLVQKEFVLFAADLGKMVHECLVVELEDLHGWKWQCCAVS